jgi:hypothetical protein
MTAVLFVSEMDDGCSAQLAGTYDRRSLWFLEKHLAELDGDVVIDCTKAERVAAECIDALRNFSRRGTREGRRVVVHTGANVRTVP